MPENSVSVAGCGCRIEWPQYSIVFCPLHKAAPKLLAACKAMAADLEVFLPLSVTPAEWPSLKAAREAISEAEGT